MKVFIPVKERDGFSVFAEGALLDMETTSRGDLYLSFSDKSILVLYYTYPNHRRLYILHSKGVGEKVRLLCTDKTASIILDVKIEKNSNNTIFIYEFSVLLG